VPEINGYNGRKTDNKKVKGRNWESHRASEEKREAMIIFLSDITKLGFSLF